MTTTEPVTRTDLSDPGGGYRYAEILTPGGVVRVTAGAVNTHTGQPVVVVEVEQQHPWEPEVRTALSGQRTDVVLTRHANTPESDR